MTAASQLPDITLERPQSMIQKLAPAGMPSVPQQVHPIFCVRPRGPYESWHHSFLHHLQNVQKPHGLMLFSKMNQQGI